MKAYNYFCKLDRVVDGDTVDALIDLGFDTLVKKRIRFYGLDTWESRTRNKEEKVKGLEAKKRTKELLSSGKFLLESHGVGKYGRVLGTLWINKDNYDNKETIENKDGYISVNDVLRIEGHASEYYGGKKEKFKK
tara:strand:- start:191 stop:595 length:405 start_codon:yes stop_codon:yes gene_type:complete